MKAMNCEEIRELLPLYAGGELDPEERVAAEAHLGFCADCGRELDLYREARAQLADLREDESPPGTWRALREGVEAELFPGKSTRARSTLDLAVRFAAVLLLGVTIGLATHVVRRGTAAPAAAPAAAAPENHGTGEVVAVGAPAGARPAAAADPGAWPLRLRIEAKPGLLAPEGASDGRHHLPRVESFPPPGERDF